MPVESTKRLRKFVDDFGKIAHPFARLAALGIAVKTTQTLAVGQFAFLNRGRSGQKFKLTTTQTLNLANRAAHD